MRNAGSGPAWLSKAAELEVCPLCVAAREIESECLFDFCRRLSEPGHEIAHFALAPGFCFDHAAKLEQAVLADDGILPGAVDLYLTVLEIVADRLGELEQDGWLQTAECPLCVTRDRELVAAARALLAALNEIPGAVRESLRAGGLCIGHFVLTWVVSDEAANRDLLRAVQCETTSVLIRRLRGLRDQGLAGDPDPAGKQEAVAIWKRAARSVSGWTVARR